MVPPPTPPTRGREFIDAVIVHELAHLREKHHQSSFWKLVYTMMPEYETIMKDQKNLD
jgi:predicted metal-dependent hydrolase